MRGAIAPLLALLALEACSRAGIVNPILFPAPTTILQAIASNAGTLAGDAALTTLRAGLAFGLAVLFAIPGGLLLGRSAALHALWRPSVDGLRTLPAAAVVPVAILLLGIDEQMRIAVAAFGACWPVLLATIDGVHATSPVMQDTIRILHLSRGQALVRVVFPAALPHVLTGARISLSIALVLTVTVEMIAGEDGLGFFVLDAERAFRYPAMYGGVLVLAVLGAVVNGGIAAVERRLVYWRT